MNSIPFQVKDISNPSELFGREKLLENLVVAARLKQNTNIIGARRFGKTCVLKSVSTLLKEKENLSVYPIYVDIKTSDIKGTDAVYRYMIGILVESLFNDGLFTESEKFGSVEITPCDDWIEIAEQLENLSSTRIQSIFQRLVYWLADLLDKTILFMIDEYEYLFKYALDSTSGFMKLRTMSSDTLPSGLRPFCFWLTGATPWDQLISEVPGSGEANTISGYEYVTPITKEAFFLMWEHECMIVDDTTTKDFLLKNKEFVYEKSGGVPFYGKNVIGSYILKNKALPDYSECKGYFQELTNKALNTGEYSILKDLAIAPRKLPISNNFESLKNKGIITIKSKEIYYLPIGFLRDFILGELSDKKATTTPESHVLMKHITDQIEVINKQRINYNKKVIFNPTIDGASLEYDLRTPCYTKEQLSDFASALYKYYYERLKVSKEEFGRFLYGKFGKCVDIARHSIGGGHEMDNFEQHQGQFSRADLYIEIMGCADEISTSQEYYKFQIEMLKRFKATLEKILKTIKENNKV